MNPPDENQIRDLGWMAAPAWMLFSFVEIAGAISEGKGQSYIHHLIDVSPGLVAAGIGVLHWYSIKEYRKAKLDNDLKIAQIESVSRRRPDPSSGD